MEENISRETIMTLDMLLIEELGRKKPVQKTKKSVRSRSNTDGSVICQFQDVDVSFYL